MKLLFENWRGYLNEKLMLKPGDNGWDLYRQLVGQAYMDAPMEQPGAKASYEALGEWVNKFFERAVVYILFSPSPSGAVLPESVEKAIIEPVGGLIFANPALFSDLVAFQFASKGLSLQASITNMLIFSFSSVSIYFNILCTLTP